MKMETTFHTLEQVKAGADPLWEHAGRIHDWRNHVPDAVQDLWNTFSLEQRTAIVDWAEKLANGEEYD